MTPEAAARATYRAGFRAATQNKPRVPPAELTWEHRHWWLAGYGDAEMERG